LNVMPLDVQVPAPTEGPPRGRISVFDDGTIRVTALSVTHGHAHPALAYRFDTPDGAIVFSGDTTVNDDLIALARKADILVHQGADLEYLERHGLAGPDLLRMCALQTDVTKVGGVAERAQVGELILNRYLLPEPTAVSDADWAERGGSGFRGKTTAGNDGLRRRLTERARGDFRGGR
jgi:ribonuclease BN (tRNA processing enzyme)